MSFGQFADVVTGVGLQYPFAKYVKVRSKSDCGFPIKFPRRQQMTAISNHTDLVEQRAIFLRTTPGHKN
jgi:hypothetical protein